MANERTAYFEHLVEIYNDGGIESWLDELGPDFEFTPDPSFPEPGTKSGDELRRWIKEWAAVWEQARLDVKEIEEHGDGVLALCQWQLTAAKTNLDVPVAEFTFLGWVDDGGKPRKLFAFFDRERALAALEAGPPA